MKLLGRIGILLMIVYKNNTRYFLFFLLHVSVILICVISTSKNIFASEPTLYFQPDSIKATVEDRFEVDILVNSAGNSISGVGIQINYKFKDIIVENIIPSSTFSDYPTIRYDNTQGKIFISAISNQKAVYSDGSKVAKIKFKAISPGESQAIIVHESGNTKDSNIAVDYENGDILKTVKPLNFEIAGISNLEIKQNKNAEDGKNWLALESVFYNIAKLSNKYSNIDNLISLIDRYIYKGDRVLSGKIDIYKKPLNKIDQSQPVIRNKFVSTKIQKSTFVNIVYVVFVLWIILILAVKFGRKWLHRKNRSYFVKGV